MRVDHFNFEQTCQNKSPSKFFTNDYFTFVENSLNKINNAEDDLVEIQHHEMDSLPHGKIESSSAEGDTLYEIAIEILRYLSSFKPDRNEKVSMMWSNTENIVTLKSNISENKKVKNYFENFVESKVINPDEYNPTYKLISIFAGKTDYVVTDDLYIKLAILIAVIYYIPINAISKKLRVIDPDQEVLFDAFPPHPLVSKVMISKDIRDNLWLFGEHSVNMKDFIITPEFHITFTDKISFLDNECLDGQTIIRIYLLIKEYVRDYPLWYFRHYICSIFAMFGYVFDVKDKYSFKILEVIAEEPLGE